MKEIKTKNRDSNIELLRIIIMVGVVILHINNSSMGGLFNIVADNNLYLLTTKTAESFFVSAVNVFIIISGYYLSKSNKRNLFKIIELIFEVLLISIVCYLATSIFIDNNFSFKGLIGNFIIKNWFVVLYCVLFILSPYVNIVIEKLDKNKYSILLLILFILFALYTTFTDLIQSKLDRSIMGVSTIGAYGSQFGYTIVHFIFMYLIAGYIRKFEITAKTWKLLLILFTCIVCVTLWSYFDETTAWSYCNPIVVIESVIIFLLFKNITINSKFINVLSKSSFMVYLTHLYLLSIIAKINITSYLLLLFVEFILPILMYLIGSLIYWIYYLIFGKLIKKLSKVKCFQFEPFKDDEMESSK